MALARRRQSVEPLGKGLPDRNGFFTVLRDAFSADRLDPVGLYFGTRGGQLMDRTTRVKAGGR